MFKERGNAGNGRRFDERRCILATATETPFAGRMDGRTDRDSYREVNVLILSIYSTAGNDEEAPAFCMERSRFFFSLILSS